MLWIIIGIILLVLLILFFSPIRIVFDYLNGERNIRLKYLFINKKLTAKSKIKKTGKSDKKIRDDTVKEKKDNNGNKKIKIIPDGFSEKIEFFKNIADSGGKALRLITKHIKIKDIYIDFIISDLDAYECALKFGKTNIIVYNILSYLGYFVRLKKKSINIKCLYNQPDSVYNLKFKVCMTPAAAIMSFVAFIFRFLVNNNKSKKASE